MAMAQSDHGIDIAVAEEQERIRRQLDRVLAHSSFSKSRRYQAFLRYVVEEKLRGNGLHLKERTIGITVFQQPLDYDTNANSVVRVTAGEIRRRLAQYYLETSQSDDILIELPLGSYVPEFRPHDAAVLPSTALTAEISTAQTQFLTQEVSAGERVITITETGTAEVPRSKKAGRWTTAACVTCFLLGAAIVAAIVMFRSPTTASDRLWKGAFNDQNVLLCAGSVDKATQPPGEPLPPELMPHAYTGFSFTIARTVAVVGSAIGHAGGSASLLPMQDVKFEDLQHSPAVLIGAFNNEWTMRLQAPLRYQFLRAPDGAFSAIIDTKNGNDKRFLLDTTANSKATRDYGILAHFQSPATGQSTVIVAGLGMHGTAAVRIFLSSPVILKEFAKTAPSGWEKGNYEIVLASDMVNKLADSPKVAAAYFW
jgi:hypothetical protein